MKSRLLMALCLAVPLTAAAQTPAEIRPEIAERADRERAQCLADLAASAEAIHARYQGIGTTEAENKILVVNFMQRLSASDVGGTMALFADNLEWWIPGDPEHVPFAGVRSKAEVERMFRAASQGLGICMKPDTFTAEGDRVAVEARSYGLSRVGNIYNQQYHLLFTVADGRISRVKAYGDTLHASRVLKEVEQAAAALDGQKTRLDRPTPD